MSECIMFIVSTKIPPGKKIRFQLALDKSFCLIAPPLTHRRLKLRQRTKVNKTMISASPPKVHNINIEKQISIPS